MKLHQHLLRLMIVGRGKNFPGVNATNYFFHRLSTSGVFFFSLHPFYVCVAMQGIQCEHNIRGLGSAAV